MLTRLFGGNLSIPLLNPCTPPVTRPECPARDLPPSSREPSSPIQAAAAAPPGSPPSWDPCLCRCRSVSEARKFVSDFPDRPRVDPFPSGAFLGGLTHKTAPDQTDTMSSVDKNRQASLEAGKRKVPPRPGSHPRYLRASTHRDPPRPLIKMSERKVISPSSADSPSADIPFRPPRIDSWRLSSSASSR